MHSVGMARRWVAILAVSGLVGVSCTRGAGRVGLREGEGFGLVQVQCAMEGFNLILGSERGTVRLDDKENPARIPPGRYSLLAFEGTVKEAGGPKWRLASKAGPVGQIIDVAQGETVKLVCGPPLKASVTIRGQSGNLIDLGLSMVGAGGLDYSASGITTRARAVPAPGVEIRDSEGTMLTQGTFRYG